MNLTYKRATIQDIDMLTKTRTEVLRAANQLSRYSGYESCGKRVL